MCMSFIIKAQDGSPLYGLTMEWGGFDLNSELILVPRGTAFIVEIVIPVLLLVRSRSAKNTIRSF